MNHWLGTAFGFGSAMSWASANAAIQVASRRVGSWSALVWAQLLGGVIAIVSAVLWDPPLSWAIVSGALAPIVGAGVAAAVAYGGLFESLRRGQVAIVSPIISAWSVGSVAIEAALGRVPTGLVAAGVLLVVFGNVVVARSADPGDSSSGSDPGGQTGSATSTPTAAIAWAIAAAAGFAVMVPLLNVAGRQVGRLWAVPLVWGAELSCLVPLLLWLGLLRRPKERADAVALSAAALFEVGGFISLSLGLGVSAVTIVSPVSSLSTMGSVALGVFLLGEKVSRAALIGAMLASIGVIVINL